MMVSIHAPHAGRDVWYYANDTEERSFNPRAPCGARPLDLLHCAIWKRFNPRAPCGARPDAVSLDVSDTEFQSTRPMRGATFSFIRIFNFFSVSIHAPHAGRDPALATSAGRFRSFNPRAPCGARLRPFFIGFMESVFQSTRPMRGATDSTQYDC